MDVTQDVLRMVRAGRLSVEDAVDLIMYERWLRTPLWVLALRALVGRLP